MTSIFDFSNCAVFLKAWIEFSGRRGSQKRIAEALGISSTLVSLVLQGEKVFTPEQACDLSHHLGLGELESEYLIGLVELERAGTSKLRDRVQNKLMKLKQTARKIESRVKKDVVLDAEAMATYYSSWIYTGIRNLVACGDWNIQSAAERLGLEREQVGAAIDFMLEQRLLVKHKGQLLVGPSNTHIGDHSPHVLSHHKNWRLSAMTKMPRKNPNDLFYTCPMSLSAEAKDLIRQKLPDIIQDILKIVHPSPSEEVACLNIDWFEY